MKVTGQIYKISDTQTVSDKFSKREFIVKTEAATPYPQFIKLECTQDKCALLDSFKANDEVSVDINLRGRLWNGDKGEQCFVTLQAWKIEKVGIGSTTQSNEQPVFKSSVDDNDGLPF
jgi:hypothetical protein